MNNTPEIMLYSLTIDCKKPYELAKFYAALLNWEMRGQDGDEYTYAYKPGTKKGEFPGILLQRNDDYVPPVFPDMLGSQQQMMHLDFIVDDLDKAVAHALDCGATVADSQFSERWHIMLDPEGHPFCLCLKQI